MSPYTDGSWRAELDRALRTEQPLHLRGPELSTTYTGMADPGLATERHLLGRHWFVSQTLATGRGITVTRGFRPGSHLLSFRWAGPRITRAMSLWRGMDGIPLQVGRDRYILLLRTPHKLINHSCDPNCGLRNGTELVALRSIYAGEELTYDYSTTMAEDAWELAPCRCCSPLCRGTIRDFKHLPADRQHYYRLLGVVGAHCVEV